MPKHITQDHPHTDHFEFNGDELRLKQRTRGGGHLTNTPITETTVAGTKYQVQSTFANGSHYEVDIDNASYGFKYTGTADKTLLLMGSLSASSDSNAVECEWEIYCGGVATGVKMINYFDKQNKNGSFAIAGRVDVKQNDLLQLYVSSDFSGAKVTHNVINVEIFEV